MGEQCVKNYENPMSMMRGLFNTVTDQRNGATELCGSLLTKTLIKIPQSHLSVKSLQCQFSL